ncbi:transcriptional regulator, TetR family [Saccharopolyspora shandongensis]|uniref:Transcriptional regulator, TetR family n=1 Tax=Saccharopolyspora shandongensis TaxID=418495 RepID=A0A1H2YNY0_9PSEU|nr:TetR/AcrR family transcriptional regulator [Saccharopolyspora shandongensis]SDX06344.1 transcriptional regulator, TetR family [Saccharopolyspora shandongensis]
MPAAAGDGTEVRLTPGAKRILDVAAELFYSRGINAVGVDTIAAESGVTKRTLYDRFGSKDGLLVTYLKTRDRRWRELVEARLDAEADPVRRALVPFDVLPEWLPQSSRGCSFVNAFAELPEPDHPGRQLIVAEKQWLRDLFRNLLAEAGAKNPEDLAVQLLSLHEGAIVSYSIAGESAAASITRAAAEALVRQALG